VHTFLCQFQIKQLNHWHIDDETPKIAHSHSLFRRRRHRYEIDESQKRYIGSEWGRPKQPRLQYLSKLRSGKRLITSRVRADRTQEKAIIFGGQR